ncbi:hypothetical protein EXIGLDRAFT_262064 [Exidia glandulosa HHB12029]|uniref:JmjC domain-containing protein n=1 Tax=Exidia glandulosa HHB12029 TaxID=1314781 RepID=A0A165DSV2_EXIGL|nr:hypothetical protein EXIGLDRAFT_262064 [Exidia glandulosa HHB12029]
MVISSRGLTLDRLVGTASNFVRAETLDRARPDLVERVNALIESGQPVIITGFHDHSDWSDDTFAVKQLTKSSALGDTRIPVLNVLNNETRDVKFTRFLDYCKAYAPCADDDDEERFYAQDIEPPKAWKRWLTSGQAIPPGFLPLGSGDMFAHLPPGSRPENILCYFGVGDTYAAWYKDPCGSVSQNLMVHGGYGASSFWFMVGTRDADAAASYFHAKKHELELEHATPFTKPADLVDAPFKIYVAQQRRGDLVIMPPRCSHQVMNQGGLVGTLAWSRMTLPSIGYAHYLELPIYNRITRAETYRLKLTLYHAVRKTAQSPPTPEMAALLDELLELLDETIIAEYSPDIHKLEPAQSGASYDAKDPDFLSCDICNADIFVSYFECAKHCEMDVCSMCYVSGRTCPCVKRMKPAVVVRFQEVLQVRNDCAKKLEHAKGERVPQMSDAGIMRSSAMQTFRAACALYAARRSTSSTVQCSHSKHDVPTSDSLHCSVCDAHVCFTHLLEGPARLHAARALVEHQRLSPAEWHALHTTPVPEDDDDADLAGMYLSAVTSKYIPRPDKDTDKAPGGWYDKMHKRAGSDEAQLQVATLLQTEVDNMVKRVRQGTRAEVTPVAAAQQLEDVVLPAPLEKPASPAVARQTTPPLVEQQRRSPLPVEPARIEAPRPPSAANVEARTNSSQREQNEDEEMNDEPVIAPRRKSKKPAPRVAESDESDDDDDMTVSSTTVVSSRPSPISVPLPPPPKPSQKLKRARDVEPASAPTPKKRKVSQGTAGPLANKAAVGAVAVKEKRPAVVKKPKGAAPLQAIAPKPSAKATSTVTTLLRAPMSARPSAASKPPPAPVASSLAITSSRRQSISSPSPSSASSTAVASASGSSARASSVEHAMDIDAVADSGPRAVPAPSLPSPPPAYTSPDPRPVSLPRPAASDPNRHARATANPTPQGHLSSANPYGHLAQDGQPGDGREGPLPAGEHAPEQVEPAPATRAVSKYPKFKKVQQVESVAPVAADGSVTGSQTVDLVGILGQMFEQNTTLLRLRDEQHHEVVQTLTSLGAGAHSQLRDILYAAARRQVQQEAAEEKLRDMQAQLIQAKADLVSARETANFMQEALRDELATTKKALERAEEELRQERAAKSAAALPMRRPPWRPNNHAPAFQHSQNVGTLSCS